LPTFLKFVTLFFDEYEASGMRGVGTRMGAILKVRELSNALIDTRAVGAQTGISMRVLVVEDEQSLLSIMITQLEKKGYTVDSCINGLEAEDYLSLSDYDCVVLDRMLPGKDGVSVLKHFRSQGKSTPVLLLTAMDSITQRVEGLDAGADDYLVKPFSFEELFARIRALTRRNFVQRDAILRAADLELNIDTGTVTRAGRAIPLSAKEYSLLEYMMRNKGIILSREQIISHVWSYDFEGDSNVVDVYIRYLRRKMDKDFSPPLIHTLRGRGYLLTDQNNG
jgi:DNA-binding response OmpR family regulator